MTTTTTQGWLLRAAEPATAHTVPAEVEYHRVLAGEKRRIGRGVLAIVLLLVGFVLFPAVVGKAATLIDVQLGNTPPTAGGTDYTPLAHASSMVSLALLAPWAMLIQRVLYRVPGASMHSVVSRFRFDVFGRALLLFGPVWLLVIGLGFLAPGEQVPWSHTDLVGIFLTTLLLTPLQAAGEEYGVRGLLFRVIGSWTKGARAGLVAGVVASSILFTLAHGATDAYLIVWYLVLWSGLAIITWRTGGLEVAIVMHAVLNTVSFAGAALLRSDLGGELQDRSAGAGSPYQLVPTLMVVLITAVVWWQTRTAGPATTPPHSPAPPDGA